MSFVVATFNVRDLFDRATRDLGRTAAGRAHGEVAERAKIEALCEVLVKLDADVLCLQEIGSLAVLERLAATLGHQIAGYPTKLAGETHDPRGLRNGLLSRWPVKARRAHPGEGPESSECRLPAVLPGQPEPAPLPFRRSLLDVDLALPGGETLTVLAVHLKSHHPLQHPLQDRPPGDQTQWARGHLRSTLYRLAEALRIRDLLDGLCQEQGRLVAVAGDFNSEEHSLAMGILRGTEELPGSAVPGRAAPSGSPPSAMTVHSCARHVGEDRRYSILFRGRRLLFDDILVSPALWARFESAGILNDDLETRLRRAGRKGRPSPDSDHAAVWARFR